MDEEEQDLLDDVSSEREADKEAMLDELLVALDDLDELEARDSNLGRNTVLKVRLCLVLFFLLILTNYHRYLSLDSVYSTTALCRLTLLLNVSILILKSRP